MSKLKAKHDVLIESIITDENYSITEDGKIFTLITKNGKAGKTWREIGTPDKEGYKRIRYRGVRIFVHRIVYRKFCGPLDETLVIDHKDAITGNCHKDNLRLMDHKTNIYYRERRKDRTT